MTNKDSVAHLISTSMPNLLLFLLHSAKTKQNPRERPKKRRQEGEKERE